MEEGKDIKKNSAEGQEQDEFQKEGIVLEALPNTMFRVKLDDSGEEMLSYLSGKMKLHRIRVLVGDKVILTTDPYGGKGRITRRQ